MENGDIANENIKASSKYSDNFSSERARLNGNSFWVAAASDTQPWIQADIGYQTYVSGVVTQGEGITSDNEIDWVTSIKVSTFCMAGIDGEVFVKDANGTAKVSITSDCKKKKTKTKQKQKQKPQVILSALRPPAL